MNILGRAIFSTLNGWHVLSGAFWCNLTYWRASQVLPVSKAFLAYKKAGFLSSAAIKQQRWLCQIFGGVDLVTEGGCGCRIMVKMVEAVDIGGVGQSEVLGIGGKGEINGRQRGDHRWDILTVLVTKSAYVSWPPFFLPLAWLSHL